MSSALCLTSPQIPAGAMSDGKERGQRCLQLPGANTPHAPELSVAIIIIRAQTQLRSQGKAPNNHMLGHTSTFLAH